jgi:uncharacterized metal-binding protein
MGAVARVTFLCDRCSEVLQASDQLAVSVEDRKIFHLSCWQALSVDCELLEVFPNLVQRVTFPTPPQVMAWYKEHPEAIEILW